MIKTGVKAVALNVRDDWVKWIRLTLTGGIAFWVTSILTSLLPLAAAYRAVLSNWSAQTVWIASLFAGLLIGGFVSCTLLRHYGKIPAKGPLTKAMLVSFCPLIVFTIVIDVPMCIQDQGYSAQVFLTGFLFNAARFLLLGAATGCQYRKLARKELS